MVLSFHPCFSGDVNRLCAGRKPNAEGLAAIQAADAVILPQGCSRALYDLARGACPLVFPDYTARFRYPGKIGQIRLFREINVAHLQTACFDKLGDYYFGRRGLGDSERFYELLGNEIENWLRSAGLK